MRSQTCLSVVLPMLAAALVAVPASAQTPVPSEAAAAADVATFRSGVNLVSVAAVVRDKQGRVMSSLDGHDFEVIDDGVRRELLEFQSTASAPASVALLVDGSGSKIGRAHV